MKTLLPTNIRTKIAFTGSKLSTCFQVKDKTKFEHNHDIVYHGICPETDCSENYIGETARRISERVKIIRVNMYTRIFLNMQLKVGIKY